MMKEELKKKFEELRDAVARLDTDRNVFDVRFNRRTGLMEIHVHKDFPAHQECHEEYVWIGEEYDFPWQKQVIINGIVYYDVITQEQFDREHAKEENNDDNQQDGQECNA